MNDNWRDTQEAEIIATTIPPTNNAESAILSDLQPGAYTAIVRGKNNTTGVGLVEAYHLVGGTSPTPTPGGPTPTPNPTATPTPNPTPTPGVRPQTPNPDAQAGSLTSRVVVGTGDAIAMNTLVIAGPTPKRVLVRGIGPSLGGSASPTRWQIRHWNFAIAAARSSLRTTIGGTLSRRKLSRPDWLRPTIWSLPSWRHCRLVPTRLFFAAIIMGPGPA